MAFNYKANNAKEIISKKKAFSLQASQIYSYISKTYGETIILDLTNQFFRYKHRAVEKKIGIAVLKQTLAKTTDTKEIGGKQYNMVMVQVQVVQL